MYIDIFSLELPLWELQHICTHLGNKPRRVKLVGHKRFIDKLLGDKKRAWVRSLLRSLPSDLASVMIFSMFDNFMVSSLLQPLLCISLFIYFIIQTAKPELHLSKLRTLLSLFNLKGLGIDWLISLASLIRGIYRLRVEQSFANTLTTAERFKLSVHDLSVWVKVFLEISSMICDETNLAEGLPIFITPIMPSILACAPQDLKQVFQALQYTEDRVRYMDKAHLNQMPTLIQC